MATAIDVRFTVAMSGDPSVAADHLAAVRSENERRGLRRADLVADPVEQVRHWWDEAAGHGLYQAEAMALATADGRGRPSVRFVLVRGLDRRGLLFHTNRQSRKGRDLGANPRAEGVLAWHPLGRQARISGPVEQVAEAESDAYWATRARGSQLAAWASPQSEAVASRDELDRRYRSEQERWEGRDVERPPHWGGYRLVPDEVEVWQGRRDRFHDRFRYCREAGGCWRVERLAP